MRKIISGPRKAAFVVLTVILLMVFLTAAPAFAAYDDYDTLRYDVSAEVSENHVIHVKENIKVDFNQSEHHGIVRYIPYAERYYRISKISCGDDEFSTESEYTNGGEGYKAIRIGSPDYTVSGQQEYVITYDLVCMRDDSADADYLSFDMLPTGWSTPIQSSTTTLTLPKDMDWDTLKFYSGVYGEESDASDYFDVSIDKTARTITARGRDLPYHVGLTVSATMEEGYWVDPANRDHAMKWLYAILLLVPLLAIFMWARWGRDPQIVKTVEFYPPEDMSPCELGYIIDGKVDDKDIASMLLYYADRGYLKVNEYEKNAFEVIKVKEIDINEKTFVKYMFDQLFLDGDIQRLDDMRAGFGDALYNMKDKIRGFYGTEKRRLFSQAADTCRSLGKFLMLVPVVAGVILISYYNYEIWSSVTVLVPVLLELVGMSMVLKNYDKKDIQSLAKNIFKFVLGIAITLAGTGIGAAIIMLYSPSDILPAGAMVLSTAVTFFFVVFMRARTKKCAEWIGKILGFRDFIRTAEYDRLKLLSDEDPEYFFNVLPYAYVMGMSTKWVKKFADIHIQTPAWADTYDHTYIMTPMWYGGMIMNTAAELADQYHTAMIEDLKASSGSSGGGSSIGGGFGGGGFSGGGFGGGGGGAW